jgi:hypothetical protein
MADIVIKASGNCNRQKQEAEIDDASHGTRPYVLLVIQRTQSYSFLPGEATQSQGKWSIQS